LYIKQNKGKISLYNPDSYRENGGTAPLAVNFSSGQMYVQTALPPGNEHSAQGRVGWVGSIDTLHSLQFTIQQTLFPVPGFEPQILGSPNP